MKLIIEPHRMKIVTESVQDVAYLKHLGCGSSDPDMHLKVAVSRFWQENMDVVESLELDIKWEDKRNASGDGRGGDCLQYLSGPSVEACKRRPPLRSSNDFVETDEN